MGNAGSAPSYYELSEAKERIDCEDSRKHQQALALDSATVAVHSLDKNTAAAIAAAEDPFFFNRCDEAHKLLAWLGSKPSAPLVVIGPKDTGKTMLLKHIEAICENFVPVLRIDLKGLQHSCPKAFAAELKDQVFDWLDAFLAVLGGVETQVKEEKLLCATKFKLFPQGLLQKLREETERSDGLGELISVLRRFVHKNGARAILIVDEAEVLKSWEVDHEPELKQLLQFLSWITKQESRNQVVLASSDDLFLRWLHHQGGLQYHFLGLGNLNEEEAKRYFETHCFIGNALEPGYENHWDAIFAATGGSPSQLKWMAQLGTVDKLDWSAAVNAMEEMAFDNLSSAVDDYIDSSEGDKSLRGWIVRVALEEMFVKNGLVPLKEMVNAISGYFGKKSYRQLEEEVWKMVQYNVFHLRYCISGMRYKDMERPAGDDYQFLMPYRPGQLKVMVKVGSALP